MSLLSPPHLHSYFIAPSEDTFTLTEIHNKENINPDIDISPFLSYTSFNTPIKSVLHSPPLWTPTSSLDDFLLPPLFLNSPLAAKLLLDNNSPLAAKPPAIIEPPELKCFISHEYAAPGYSASRSFNFKSLVESFCGNTLNVLTLGRAEVFGSHFLVGSNCSQSNYIICGNVAAMLESGGSSPMSTALAVNEPVHDLHWLNSSAIFAATGQGNMQLFKISENRSIIEPSIILSDIHSDYICETAVKPFQSYQLASGGWDKRLCITDLEAQQLLCCKDTESCITSVKWSKWNQGECISITTDEGYYKLYDSRQSLRGQAAWETDLGKINPFCHERYTDHHILLGDADGGIHHMDMRYDRNKAM